MLRSSGTDTATCFHLVRHGVHAEYGQRLSGRAGAAALTPEGRLQAAALALWASRHGVSAIHASPRARTQETAAIIAARHAEAPLSVEALDEVDFGAWNGFAFADLEGDPLWREWNARRSTGSTPGGETMAQALTRVVAHIESVATQSPGATVLCVTHCDIIRGTIAHYLGLSLDHILRFDIDPGSVSTILFDGSGARVTRINERPALGGEGQER